MLYAFFNFCEVQNPSKCLIYSFFSYIYIHIYNGILDLKHNPFWKAVPGPKCSRSEAILSIGNNVNNFDPFHDPRSGVPNVVDIDPEGSMNSQEVNE